MTEENYYPPHYDEEDLVHECTECGRPMENPGQVCSGTCHEASML